MKVAVVGGSAPSTPHLLTDARLVEHAGTSFVLYGRDAERLDAVRNAALALAPRLHGRLAVTTDRDAAFEGADAVIVQMRVGGLASRAHDERFPLACGIPGDEGLGPGGFAAAWRTWPLLRDVLGAVARIAPQAHVALMTAPLGVLARCAFDAFPGLDVAGLCELPALVLHDVRARLGGAERLSYAYAGVNHLGWFTALALGKRDVLDAYAEARGTAAYPTTADIRAAGAVPLAYVRLHDHRARSVAEQRAAEPRARILSDLAARAFHAFATGEAPAIRAVLAERPAIWYREAVVPWIAAHRDGRAPETFFLTVRNRGYLNCAAASSAVEIPHRVRAGRFVRHGPPASLPPRIAETIAALTAYESLAAHAVTERSEPGVIDALRMHPWVDDRVVAKELARGVVGAP